MKMRQLNIMEKSGTDHPAAWCYIPKNGDLNRTAAKYCRLE